MKPFLKAFHKRLKHRIEPIVSLMTHRKRLVIPDSRLELLLRIVDGTNVASSKLKSLAEPTDSLHKVSICFETKMHPTYIHGAVDGLEFHVHWLSFTILSYMDAIGLSELDIVNSWSGEGALHLLLD